MTVKNFGTIKYFSISYVVLILIPILSELYHKAATSSQTFERAVAFPVTLRWLYAASLLYAVAIAIYQYFYPAIIKKYESREDYLNNAFALFYRAHPQHRLAIVLSHLNPKLDVQSLETITQLMRTIASTIGQDRQNAQEELDRTVETLHPDAIQRYLANDWDLKNRERRLAIGISLILYLLATGILIMLLILRTIRVFNPS